MAIRSISIQRNGEIRIQHSQEEFVVSASERTRGDVKDTGTLRARLAASRGKELAVPVHFYVDPSGNEYLIVGQMLTHHLPGQTSDSERAR